MLDPRLQILDHSLVRALLFFVLVCCAYTAGSFLANRWRNRSTLRGLETRFQKQYPGAQPDYETRKTWESYLLPWDPVRSASYGLLWAAGPGCLAFLFLCFSPWPTMNNFATLAYQQPPLRVTFLFAEPTDDGFHFEGDVWNQSDQPLPVQASVKLLNASGANVAAATAQVVPERLSPRDKGQFFISVTTPAQATDFSLQFVDALGQELKYAKGFPNEPEPIDPKAAHRIRGLPRLKK